VAGLGFKDFQVGEVLTSSDVDGYLMQQTVMRFADSAARGSALGTAAGTGVPLAEGMVSYLDDTNVLSVYDGATWNPFGLVSQVVHVSKTNTFSTTSSTFVDVTGLSLSITPSSSSSKVLLVGAINMGISTAGSGGDYGWCRLNGGNVSTGLTANGMVRTPLDVASEVRAASVVYLDSPATTSATSYAWQARRVIGTVYINTSQNGTYSQLVSSLTAIEVRA